MRVRKMDLPNLFIPGAAKSGTSAFGMELTNKTEAKSVYMNSRVIFKC